MAKFDRNQMGQKFVRYYRSTIELEERFLRNARNHPALQGIPFWISAVLTGILAVFYAKTLTLADHWVQGFFASNPYWLFLVTPLCFIGAWFLVRQFAPEAKGSGIPQVMVAIQIWPEEQHRGLLRQLLSARTTMIKILSSSLCVLGGGAVGREGPTIQIAAAVFHSVGKRFRRFFPQMNPDHWLVAGGGAGIAAAFNTPLGGLVYAIEELATSHFNRFKTSLISAVIVAGLAAQWLTGSYLYLGYPKLVPASFDLIPWAIFIGVLCGGGGAAFAKMLSKIVKYRSQVKDFRKNLLLVGGLGILLVILAMFLDPRTLGPGQATLTQLLFEEGSSSNWKLAFVRFFAPLISYATGCAGGIFAPSLAAGGVLGSWIATWTETGATNTFILLGMIGFLTGVTQTPFTAFVLVLEMTDRHSSIFLMMLAAVFAAWTAKSVDSFSFYDRIKQQYLEHEGTPIVSNKE